MLFKIFKRISMLKNEMNDPLLINSTFPALKIS